MVSMKDSHDDDDNIYFTKLSTGPSSTSVFNFFFLSKFELNEMISFGEREKPEYSDKSLSEQSR